MPPSHPPDRVHPADIAERLRQELPRLQKVYGVRYLGLFGSRIHGDNRKKSDLDVLVEFSRTPGMFRFLDLERELSGLLGFRIDLVLKRALKPAIGKRILERVVEV